MDMAFKTLGRALLEVLALGLLDIYKSFHLYVDQRKGIGKGVLTQILGPWKRLVYLSKKLGLMAQGWLACLRIIALLVKDADKITTGQEFVIHHSHSIEGTPKDPTS